jgi:dihydropyrimidinase
MDFDHVVRGGLVLTPDGLRSVDVAVLDGRFAAVEPTLEGTGAPEIDARGCHVLPGAIDAHVHLGLTLQGELSRDDARWGTLAAICGGVTTVGDFTVQDAGEGLLASIHRRLDGGEGTRCDWFLHANVTSPTPGALAEIPDAVRAGVASFKLFLAYAGLRVDRPTLARVMDRVAREGALTMVHAEDASVIEAATADLVARGRLAARHFFGSRPAEAEARAVSLVGEVARELDAPAYIVHLSSAAGLDAARAARDRGTSLLLETCPQYLWLTSGPATPLHAERLVCAPPIRLPEDCAALWDALADGTIDVLATDHCPFTSLQKAARADDFRAIPGGVPGVETVLPLAYDAALSGALSFDRLGEVLASTPARLFGLAHRKGAIRTGLDADFVILDPEGETRVTASRLHSRTDYTPYEGLTLRGAIRDVWLRGELAAREVPGGRVELYGGVRGEYVRAKRG